MSDIIRERLQEDNPDALLADGFDEALIGTVRRCGDPVLAAYDYDKCVEVLMRRHNMDWEAAVEFMEFNVVGSYLGPNTPVFVQR